MGPCYPKPSTPTWQPGHAPAGCKLYLPLAEGAGATVRDLANSYNGSFVGTPTWQRGLYGPQLGGFTTGNYVSVSPPNQIVGAVYPFWIATLAANTSATLSMVAISQGSTTNGSVRVFISYNQTASGTLAYGLKDNTGAGPGGSGVLASGLPTTDGLPHCVLAVSYSATDHRLYWDGRQVASSTTSLGAVTANALACGVLFSVSASNPFGGSLIWAGAGNGSVPNPMLLATDLLTGQFAAVRPRSRLAMFAAASASPTTTIFARRGRSSRVGSRGAA